MLYPLKFKPFLKYYPYGGRRLAGLLHKAEVPIDRDVAESWEISDHGPEQSIVVNGPLAGLTLRALMERYGAQLVGDEVWQRYGNYFPLLLKFLDCDKRLPAHMHPNDAHAVRLGLADKGKTEAWYIVKADAGAAAYSGSLPGLTPQAFRAAIARGDTYDGVMNKVATHTDETYFVPPGRLHGLDAGNLAFEIQQNSDAGFGWDWAGFVEAGVISAEDAAVHPELAIECAYYENGATETTRPLSISCPPAERTLCAACNFFVLEHWTSTQPFAINDDGARFNTYTVIAGEAAFTVPGAEPVQAVLGESLLVPPCPALQIDPQGSVTLLRCYVPQLLRDIVTPLRSFGIADTDIAWLGSYGRGNDLLPLLGLAQEALSL